MFSFRDVRTSEIKLQLNNAAGGRLYCTRPHIAETEIKQNCRRSAETKPRPSAVLFYFSFISRCATGLNTMHLMNCCYRNLTYITTSVNEVMSVMIEHCLRRKDTSLLKTLLLDCAVQRNLLKCITVGFHSLLRVTILFHFTSFYIVLVEF